MFIFIVLFGLIGPRFALGWLWLFSDWIGNAIDSTFIAVMGFFLAPWTTLAYVAVAQSGQPSLLGWLVVGLGAATDLGSYGASVATRS